MTHLSAKRPIIQSVSKTEQVYRHLYQQIIECQLAPGSRLVIDQIALELGVSQIPVREAVFRLEQAGLVTFEHHVGATVTELRANHISEIFQVLESMEIISGRAACARVSNQDIGYLEKLTQDMSKVMDQPRQWSRYNMVFHEYICDIAAMALIKKVLHEALSHWDRLRHFYLEEVSARRVELAQQEHLQLLEALRRGDADGFEQIIKQHNQTSLKAYMHHLEQQGDLHAA
jgi:DNA-binding GntR family transcriptional regulator